jgi:hypothetical protein
VKRLLATSVVAVLMLACSTADGAGVAWEFGTPLEVNVADVPIENSRDGVALAMGAFLPATRHIDVGVRATYRVAASDQSDREFFMAPEEHIIGCYGDVSQFLTVAFQARIPSAVASSAYMYMVFSAGWLIADLGEVRYLYTDQNHPGEEYLVRLRGQFERRGLISTGLGVAFPEREGRRIVLELHAGVISEEGGFWVTAGPFVRFGG